jgi:hypothetical protein
MSTLSKIVDQGIQYLALAAAVGLFIYDIQRVNPNSTVSYVTVGGALSLIFILLLVKIPSLNLFVNKLWSTISSPLLMIITMSSIVCFAIIYLLYTLFNFSSELYNEWILNQKQGSPDIDYATLLLNVIGTLGSAGILAFLFRKGSNGIIYAFMVLLYTPYMLFSALLHKMK